MIGKEAPVYPTTLVGIASGIAQRDFVALQAMTAFIGSMYENEYKGNGTKSVVIDMAQVAKMSYQMADAMIAESVKK